MMSLSDMDRDLAIYVHWPFCQSKCPYCDFNSHVASAIDHDQWRRAYKRSIEAYAERLPGRRITSIFFGGGTPSLMEPRTAGLILDEIAHHFPQIENMEVTLEANPSSSEASSFAAFRRAGVNRLSLGVQSFDDQALRFLGRAHDANEAREAVALAAKHFDRFSFDLIYARAGQTPLSWRTELAEALRIGASHLSLYQLTIEPSTLFHTRSNRGEALTLPDDDAAAMFEETQATLQAAGLPAYEISNHAAPGHESRHNLTYWHYDDYIGIGPGAHGRYRVSGQRLATEAHKQPDVWLRTTQEDGFGLKKEEAIDEKTAKTESLLMGLRLTSGIAKADWQAKFGVALDASLDKDAKTKLIETGFLEEDALAVRATPAGRQRLNAVLAFVASD